MIGAANRTVFVTDLFCDEVIVIGQDRIELVAQGLIYGYQTTSLVQALLADCDALASLSVVIAR